MAPNSATEAIMVNALLNGCGKASLKGENNTKLNAESKIMIGDRASASS